MTHPLWSTDIIEESPPAYLARVGHIFAEFGEKTQDSGNISYGVQVGTDRFFVKTAGDPDDLRWFPPHSNRVSLLRNAIRMRQSCNHVALPALHHVIESLHGPLLIYEWVVGDLLGVPSAIRNDPQSALSRFVALPVQMIAAVLDVIYEVHELLADAGWVAVDFYDGCLIYNFETHELRIVDLDMYRPEPFVNEMGRMFGSSRFMAPEEFVLGARIDQRTTVFTLGRAAAVFLGQCSTDRSRFRASDALHEVVFRACQSDPDDRFPTVHAFRTAWQDARQMGC